jgi:hypothetical protein
MSTLAVDYFSTLDGYGYGEGAPAYFGLAVKGATPRIRCLGGVMSSVVGGVRSGCGLARTASETPGPSDRAALHARPRWGRGLCVWPASRHVLGKFPRGCGEVNGVDQAAGRYS